MYRGFGGFCCTILLPDIVNLGDCGVFFSFNYMFSILVHEEILILNWCL